MSFERWTLGDEFRSRVCPRRLITRDSLMWMQLYSAWSDGHLLIAGGLLDQPAIYLGAMTRISALYSEARETTNGGKG